MSIEENDSGFHETLQRLDNAVDEDAIDILTKIDRYAHTMRSHFETNVLVHYRLSWTAFAIMYELWRYGKLEVRFLADRIGISKATVSNVSNTLEKKGYCGRESDESDRRKTRLFLTEEGRTTVSALYPPFHEEEKRLVSHLNQGEKTTLIRLLQKMDWNQEDMKHE